MPKPINIELYQCEVCSTIYTQYIEAKKCERKPIKSDLSQYKIGDTVKYLFLPKYSSDLREAIVKLGKVDAISYTVDKEHHVKTYHVGKDKLQEHHVVTVKLLVTIQTY